MVNNVNNQISEEFNFRIMHRLGPISNYATMEPRNFVDSKIKTVVEEHINNFSFIIGIGFNPQNGLSNEFYL